MAVYGVAVSQYAFAPGTFAYDAATCTATWTLTTAVGADKLLLALDADIVTGPGNVALDGEWTNPPVGNPGGSDSFPSGDGSAGGDFAFRLNVLPGDVNRSGGVVSGTDVTQTRNAQGSPPGGVGSLYTIFKDVNGSASITGTDVTNVRNSQGLSLPAAEPTAPASLAFTQSTSPSASNASAIRRLALRADLLEDVVAGALLA